MGRTATAAVAADRYCVELPAQADFPAWRERARRLVTNGVEPERIDWFVAGDEDGLFGARASPLPPDRAELPITVTARFMDLAETAICHSDPQRFAFLYRLLWRLQREAGLMCVASDADILRLEAMAKSVRRDIHKMRAFVRFRQVGEAPDESYVAWFEPEHHIVERNSPFFVRRFTGMRWTILTPRLSARWDGESLSFAPGASRSDAPADDAAEDLWRTYFSSIFNPARLKPRAMTAEMPKKYWRNLPEAALIPGMIAGAEKAERQMIARGPTAPAPHHAGVRQRHWMKKEPALAMLKDEPTTLDALREAAAGCEKCPLWRDATQTVFGEGPADASLVFVGEQPGDQEDIAGRPFVGPAGRLFDEVAKEAGIDREAAYVTNAVKHFKFEPRGKRRLHKRPDAGEIQACRWWLDRELAILQPALVVALGATAAQSLLGKAVPITRMRGQTVVRDDGLRVFLTVHPSYLLRIPDKTAAAAERARFLSDLKAVKALAQA